jgi:hypothetical protein
MLKKGLKNDFNEIWYFPLIKSKFGKKIKETMISFPSTSIEGVQG